MVGPAELVALWTISKEIAQKTLGKQMWRAVQRELTPTQMKKAQLHRDCHPRNQCLQPNQKRRKQKLYNSIDPSILTTITVAERDMGEGDQFNIFYKIKIVTTSAYSDFQALLRQVVWCMKHLALSIPTTGFLVFTCPNIKVLRRSKIQDLAGLRGEQEIHLLLLCPPPRESSILERKERAFRAVVTSTVYQVNSPESVL